MGRRTIFLPKDKRVFSSLGNLLILLALAGLSLSLYPLVKAEITFRRSRLPQQKLVSQFARINAAAVAPTVIPPDPNFSLIIPKIAASAPVIANVDAQNAQKYNQALKQGVAHGAGTVFPGMKGSVWLFAHSAASPWDIRNYNAVFYLLDRMEEGDEVIVFFQGKRFNYRVSEKMIVSSKDTSFYSQKEEEILVLQTCWPPGTTQKTLLVLARPLT